MITVSQSTKRKLSLLQLAEELGNVSKARKIIGYTATRSTRSRRPSKSAASPPWSRSAAAPEPTPQPGSRAVQCQILDLYLEKPTYGSQRIVNEIRLQGVDVSPPDVRGVCLCATTWRLLRLEAAAQEQNRVLTEEQIHLL